MANVTERRASKKNAFLEDGVSIGLEGSSGHGFCKKFCFGAYAWPTLSSEFFFGALGNQLITAFRVSANHVVPYLLIWRFSTILQAPLLGKIQDGEYFGPLFEAIGMKKKTTYKTDADGKEVRGEDGKRIVVRKGWGRRAPHLTYTNAALVVMAFFLYSPATWCNLATVSDETAKLNDATIYSWKQEDGEWVDGVFPFSPVSGLDCSKKLTLNTSIGMQYFNTTYTDTTGGMTPLYSQDICSNLVGLNSVCWPGPTGAPETGDNKPRVCGHMNGAGLGLHWFLLVLFMKFFTETEYAAMGPARIEVYPWKEERVQVGAMLVVYAILAILVFVVGNAQIQGVNELGSAPNGGQSIRNGWALYLAISNLIGFCSIPAVRDAQQQTDVKATNVFQEYKHILTSKHEAHYAFRIFLIHRSLSSFWNGVRIGTIVYYLMYARMVPLSQAAGVIALGGGIGLFLNAIMQCIWGCVFGMKASKGREHGRDPKIWTLVVYVGGIIGWLLITALMLQPIKPGTAIGTGFGIVIMAIYHEIQNSITGALDASWLGWCHDLDNHYWQVEQGVKKRREAIYKSLQAVCERLSTFIAELLVNAVLVLGTNPICDTSLQPKDMNPKCGESLFHYWLILIPIARIIQTVAVYMFPITGEKLKTLYLKQAEFQKAIEGTAAANTVSFVQKNQKNPILPGSKTMEVTLPEGATPGMELEYPLSDGSKVKVVVQEGQNAGEKVTVNLGK